MPAPSSKPRPSPPSRRRRGSPSTSNRKAKGASAFRPSSSCASAPRPRNANAPWSAPICSACWCAASFGSTSAIAREPSARRSPSSSPSSSWPSPPRFSKLGSKGARIIAGSSSSESCSAFVSAPGEKRRRRRRRRAARRGPLGRNRHLDFARRNAGRARARGPHLSPRRRPGARRSDGGFRTGPRPSLGAPRPLAATESAPHHLPPRPQVARRTPARSEVRRRQGEPGARDVPRFRGDDPGPGHAVAPGGEAALHALLDGDVPRHRSPGHVPLRRSTHRRRVARNGMRREAQRRISVAPPDAARRQRGDTVRPGAALSRRKHGPARFRFG